MRKVREKLEILDTVDLYITRFIEDKLGEGLVDNENEEYEISLEGDLRSKSGKGEVNERNKRRIWIKNYGDRVIDKVKELKELESGEKKRRQLMSKRENMDTECFGKISME